MLYVRAARPSYFMQAVLQNPTFVLFSILCLGLALGNIKIKGISLGSSGVLFVGLLAGHFGLSIPDGFTGFGTALFVYCVGLGVGNRFFSSLGSTGSKLVMLALVVIVMAAATTWGLCSLLGISKETAVGIFAGAMTSTPALAAAAEHVSDQAGLNIGYGVAYPFGVIGVILFVQLLPRLLKQDLSKIKNEGDEGSDPEKIISRVVHVSNPELFGKSIDEFESNGQIRCRITRKVVNGQMLPLDEGDKFIEGCGVLLVGSRRDVMHESMMLGSIEIEHQHPRSFGDECAELIILNPKLCQMPLGEMRPLAQYGVVISRVTRLGVTFVPTSTTQIVRNDVVRVVGTPEAIEEFRKFCGHRSSAINSTDILSLAGGVALGILLGKVQIGFGDGATFSLGMAGGPLFVALVLGHFGKVGPIVGYIPRPSRVFIMDLALMLFLASAGVAGGGKLVETLQAQGVSMFLIGAAVTIIPMFCGFLLARKFLKMSLPESLGGICGSMTSTPALGAITAKTDAQSPVIAYATAYPAALILMALSAKLILSLMG